MISAIFAFLKTIGSIFLFFVKKKEQGNTPNAKSKKDIEEFDDALVHDDSDNVANKFGELFQDADRYDSGQHEADQDGKR